MASLEDKEEHHEDWNEENYHANGVYVGQELEDPRDGVRTPGDADGEGKADEEDDDYDLDGDEEGLGDEDENAAEEYNEDVDIVGGPASPDPEPPQQTTGDAEEAPTETGKTEENEKASNKKQRERRSDTARFSKEDKKKQNDQEGPHEWELYGEIPPEMLPAPLIKVMNIPGKGAEGDVSEAGLRDLLESSGLSVHSVAFDAPGGSDKRRIAYVRLEPPQPSWTLKTEEGKGVEDDSSEQGRSSRKRSRSAVNGGSIDAAAEEAVRTLTSLEPKLELGGQPLQFSAHKEQATLFIGNLTEDWQDVEKLKEDLSKHGQLERAFIARNPKGASKNYAIVEYSIPYAASKAKRGLDEIEAFMRPDMSRRGHRDGDSAGGRVEQVKLLRSEFAAIRSVQSQFSRTLFVSNLPPRYKDVRELRTIFEEFGQISDINIPINQMTQQSRGFGFVEYRRSSYADIGYRAFLEDPERCKLGKLLVSFANPAKPSGERDRDRDRGRSRDQQQQGAGRNQMQGGFNRGSPRRDGADRRGGPRGGGILPGGGAGGRGMVGGGAGGGMGGRPFGGGPMGGLLPGQGPPALGDAGFGPLGSPMANGPAFRGGRGAGGRGFGRGGFGVPPLSGGPEALIAAQQLAQMQQLQLQRQVQAQMQRQIQAQQAALQAQLLEAQQAAQQAQQQAAQFQRAATEAQAKAAAEAEARRRLEEEARRAAARIQAAPTTNNAYTKQQQQRPQQHQTPASVAKGGGGAGRGNQIGPAASGFSAGFDTAAQLAAAAGQGVAAAGYGPAGYGAVDPSAAAYGAHAAGYGSQVAGHGGTASQGGGYGAAADHAAALGQRTSQDAYAGYGAASQTGYGQGRFDEDAAYGSYGSMKQEYTDPSAATAYQTPGYQGQAGYGATGVAVASVYGAADAGGYGSYGSAGNFGAAANAGYRGDAATASQYNGYGAANTAGTAGAGYGSQGYDAAAAYGSQAYGSQSGYGQQASQQASYDTASAQMAGGYGSHQAGYGSQQSGYGTAGAGQKRDTAGYDAAAAQQFAYGGGYGAAFGSQGSGNASKRTRY